jgi:hypothetical protein
MSKYPATEQSIREFIASGDEYGMGFASAWLLHAVDHVLKLDRELTPQTVITPENRRECGLAIIDLEHAFAEYNRATQRVHDDDPRGFHTLH